ncbi:MAG: NUDIX hydrolase [Anaerolineales bacterium]|nr:NUDIX hydrolase [Anaerolineales bacterium]
MVRHTRYQGAIIDHDSMLLIRHQDHSTGRKYWVIPGGGLDAGETEKECVIREMKEETHLDVIVEQLILHEPAPPHDSYQWIKTFLCRPLNGDARPGYEPEAEASAIYSIVEVRWFDLRDENSWDKQLFQDPLTYHQLVQLKEALGYT